MKKINDKLNQDKPNEKSNLTNLENHFQINELAENYGNYYEIGRLKGESDYDYRSAVAGELRRTGHLIEAHEALSGRRYDDPNQGPMGPMTGLIGAMAKALQGIEHYPGDSEREIGSDIVARILVRNEDGSAEYIRTVFNTFGPDAGMNILDAFSRKK